MNVVVRVPEGRASQLSVLPRQEEYLALFFADEYYRKR